MSSMYSTSDAGEESYVRLVSSDDFNFFVPRQVIDNTSKTMAGMIEGPEDQDTTESEGAPYIKLQYQSRVVQKVCQYMLYKDRYSNTMEEIPDFNVESEDAVTLLDAATFLEL